jgi:hypothetical protein
MNTTATAEISHLSLGILGDFFKEYERQLRIIDENAIGSTLDLADIRIDRVLCLIKQDKRDAILKEFEEFNKRTYPQFTNVNKFIAAFANNLQREPNLEGYQYQHYEILLGIPIMVVSDQMMDILYNDSVGGLHMEEVGIVCQEGPKADYFLTHEVIHAFVEFLKNRGTFKETKTGLFGIRTVYDSVVSLLRNETIAYLLAVPGQLGSMELATACHALTQHTPAELDKLNPELQSIVDMICKLDKSGKLNPEQVARLALLEPTMNGFCQGIVDALNAKKS